MSMKGSTARKGKTFSLSSYSTPTSSSASRAVARQGQGLSSSHGGSGGKSKATVSSPSLQDLPEDEKLKVARIVEKLIEVGNKHEETLATLHREREEHEHATQALQQHLEAQLSIIEDAMKVKDTRIHALETKEHMMSSMLLLYQSKLRNVSDLHTLSRHRDEETKQRERALREELAHFQAVVDTQKKVIASFDETKQQLELSYSLTLQALQRKVIALEDSLAAQAAERERLQSESGAARAQSTRLERELVGVRAQLHALSLSQSVPLSLAAPSSSSSLSRRSPSAENDEKTTKSLSLALQSVRERQRDGEEEEDESTGLLSAIAAAIPVTESMEFQAKQELLRASERENDPLRGAAMSIRETEREREREREGEGEGYDDYSAMFNTSADGALSLALPRTEMRGSEIDAAALASPKTAESPMRLKKAFKLGGLLRTATKENTDQDQAVARTPIRRKPMRIIANSIDLRSSAASDDSLTLTSPSTPGTVFKHLQTRENSAEQDKEEKATESNSFYSVMYNDSDTSLSTIDVNASSDLLFPSSSSPIKTSGTQGTAVGEGERERLTASTGVEAQPTRGESQRGRPRESVPPRATGIAVTSSPTPSAPSAAPTAAAAAASLPGSASAHTPKGGAATTYSLLAQLPQHRRSKSPSPSLSPSLSSATQASQYIQFHTSPSSSSSERRVAPHSAEQEEEKKKRPKSIFDTLDGESVTPRTRSREDEEFLSHSDKTLRKDVRGSTERERDRERSSSMPRSALKKSPPSSSSAAPPAAAATATIVGNAISFASPVQQQDTARAHVEKKDDAKTRKAPSPPSSSSSSSASTHKTPPSSSLSLSSLSQTRGGSPGSAIKVSLPKVSAIRRSEEPAHARKASPPRSARRKESKSSSAGKSSSQSKDLVDFGGNLYDASLFDLLEDLD